MDEQRGAEAGAAKPLQGVETEVGPERVDSSLKGAVMHVQDAGGPAHGLRRHQGRDGFPCPRMVRDTVQLIRLTAGL